MADEGLAEIQHQVGKDCLSPWPLTQVKWDLTLPLMAQVKHIENTIIYLAKGDWSVARWTPPASATPEGHAPEA